MNYSEVVDYISNIPKFTGKHTVEETRAFYKELLPDTSQMKIIHIAGTNGKGSVCAYLRSILRHMGYNVGVFISPHLVKINERIRINEEDITDEEFLEIFNTLKGNLIPGGYHPSYFEFIFFMGMLYFAKKKPDYIILETGLGGRLDATNAIDTALVNVITRIGFDHMAYLGDSLEEIAKEKAGILRDGVPLVYDACVSEAEKVIHEQARLHDCPEFPVSENDFSLESFNNKNIDFSYLSRYYRNVNLKVGTTAIYQMENASLAVRTAEVIFSKEELSLEIIKAGVEDTYWKGRMDELLPGVIIDGAHNEDGIRAFLDSVSYHSCQGKRFLVFGVVSDKEYDKMIEDVIDSKLFYSVDLVSIDDARGVKSESLAKLFRDKGFDRIHLHDSVCRAIDEVSLRRGQSDRIYIAGSLYLVGEVLDYLKK